MLQRLGRRASLLGVQIQTAIEQVGKERQLPCLGLIHSFGGWQKPRFEVACRADDVERFDNVLLSQEGVSSILACHDWGDGDSHGGCGDEMKETTHLASQLVLLDALKVQKVIKVHRRKLCSAQHLVTEFASALHDRPKHLIVRPPREQNLARIQLVQSTADGPDVNGKIVREPKN